MTDRRITLQVTETSSQPVPGNALTELPNSLQQLQNLHTLQASQNRIERLPEFLLAPFSSPDDNMKTLGFVDAYSQKVNNMIHHQQQQQMDGQERKAPLSRVNLRSNQLKGSIILGNYGVSWGNVPAFTL